MTETAKKSAGEQKDNWEGYAERECGDHRTTGRRAWCFNCSEWCYPQFPCKGCERPQLEARIETLAKHLQNLYDWGPGIDAPAAAIAAWDEAHRALTTDRLSGEVPQ